MNAVENHPTTNLQLSLTAEERECLLFLLDTALKETRIEEHRTRTLSFREHVVQRKELIAELLRKLGEATP